MTDRKSKIKETEKQKEEFEVEENSIELNEGIDLWPENEESLRDEILMKRTDIGEHFIDHKGRNVENENMKNEQKNDNTLTKWWELAGGKNSQLEVKDGLLYQKGKMLGQEIYRLVLPAERRERVLNLAHESMFGRHLGDKKQQKGSV